METFWHEIPMSIRSSFKGDGARTDRKYIIGNFTKLMIRDRVAHPRQFRPFFNRFGRACSNHERSIS